MKTCEFCKQTKEDLLEMVADCEVNEHGQRKQTTVHLCVECRRCRGTGCEDVFDGYTEDFTACICLNEVYCDSCEGDNIAGFCDICKCHIHESSYSCNHLYYAQDYGVQGTGSFVSWDYPEYHDGVFGAMFDVFLEFMGAKFALDLRFELHLQDTWLDSYNHHLDIDSLRDTYGIPIPCNIFGGYYTKRVCYRYEIDEWKDWIRSCWERDKYGEVEFWLDGICKETTEANEYTIELIDKWLVKNKDIHFVHRVDSGVVNNSLEYKEYLLDINGDIEDEGN